MPAQPNDKIMRLLSIPAPLVGETVERFMSDLDEQWRVSATRLVTGTDELDTALGGGTSTSVCVCLAFRACSAPCIVAQLPRGSALRLRVRCSLLPSGSVSRAQSYSCPVSRCARRLRHRVAATGRPALASAAAG